MMSEKTHFIICKEKGMRGGFLFWRDNSKGYTEDYEKAGAFTEEEALNIQKETHNENFAIPIRIIAGMPKITIIEGNAQSLYGGRK